MSTIIYDWKTSQKLNDWKIEGTGEMFHHQDGSLHVRTFNMGPLRRATNCWLRNVELPENFEIEWTYRNGSETNSRITTEGAILVFNAKPLALTNLFDDPRPYGVYSDLCSYGKMVAYSFGFYRTPYGIPTQFRKIGGHVPKTWGESGPSWKTEDGVDFETLTVLSRADEPLTESDRGKPANYKLTHQDKNIKIWCNDKLLHDWTELGQYRYYKDHLVGGKLCFRNFNGYIESYFSNIVVRKL